MPSVAALYDIHGMPFGEPGAFWVLLGPEVERRRTSYDLDRAAERIRATASPEAEDMARSIVEPPSEATMLEAYVKAEPNSHSTQTADHGTSILKESHPTARCPRDRPIVLQPSALDVRSAIE